MVAFGAGPGGLSDAHLSTTYSFLLTAGLSAMLIIHNLRPSVLQANLRSCGVAVARLTKTAREIERKTFHLAGLLVPLIYQQLLNLGLSHGQCASVAWALTIAGWTADILRLSVPAVSRNFPGRRLLRHHERHQLCGACYFSLGISRPAFPSAPRSCSPQALERVHAGHASPRQAVR